MNQSEAMLYKAIGFMNCLLHKSTDCCLTPVTTNKELAKRLKLLIKTTTELNICYKVNSPERKKLLKQKEDYEAWLESLNENI